MLGEVYFICVVLSIVVVECVRFVVGIVGLMLL